MYFGLNIRKQLITSKPCFNKTEIHYDTNLNLAKLNWLFTVYRRL